MRISVYIYISINENKCYSYWELKVSLVIVVSSNNPVNTRRAVFFRILSFLIIMYNCIILFYYNFIYYNICFKIYQGKEEIVNHEFDKFELRE